MRPKTKQTLQEIAIGFALGAGLMASFLFFGLRAKAAPADMSGLSCIPRHEIIDMMRREEYEGLDMAVDPALREDHEPVDYGDSAGAYYSQSDLDLLAALVWAEAGDQDFVGQRIVADCVLNRVRSAEWPNSVEAVIYQPGQFSVVANGRLSQGFANATPENYEAARLALSGDHYDTQVIYFSMYTCANGVFAYQHGDHYIGY